MQNKKSLLIDVLVFALAVLPVYAGFTFFIRTVGYYFTILGNWASIIIVYSLAAAYCFAYFKNKYYNPITKKGGIVFLAIVVLLKVASIVLFIMNAKLYFSNFKYHVVSYIFPIDYFVLFIAYVALDVLLIKDIRKGNVKNREKKGFVKTLLLVLFFISLYLTMFACGSFIIGFQSIEVLFQDYSIYYLVLMLLLILPTVSLVFIWRSLGNDNYKIVKRVLGIISVVLLIVLIVLQVIDPNFMIHAAKMFFPLDFFGCIAFGPVFLTLIQIVPIICCVKTFLKPKKEQTIE